MNTQSPQFHIADKLTRDHEKGYANHAADRGGETYAGIARNFWPDWSGWQAIDQYKLQSGFPNNIDHDRLYKYVTNFYHDHFWRPIQGRDLAHQLIANEVYDMAVNGGVGQAGKFLQRALNLLNRNGKDYADLRVDGAIGPATINALNTYLMKRGMDGVYFLGYYLFGFRASLYIRLATKHPEQELFMNGWAKRGAQNALVYAKHFLGVDDDETV